MSRIEPNPCHTAADVWERARHVAALRRASFKPLPPPPPMVAAPKPPAMVPLPPAPVSTAMPPPAPEPPQEPKPPKPFIISVRTVIGAAAAHFGMTSMALLSPRREGLLPLQRQIAMYVAKEVTSRSMPWIGRCFDNRDHTTILHGIRKINRLIDAKNENVLADIQAILARLQAYRAGDASAIAEPAPLAAVIAHPVRSRKPWTDEEILRLARLRAKEQRSRKEAAAALGRDPRAIKAKEIEIGMSQIREMAV